MAYHLYVVEFPNGKRYFGITKQTLTQRWWHHQHKARNNPRLPVHVAIRKYGVNSLVPVCLATGDQETILNLEIEFILYFKTTDRRFGYNVALGGQLSPMLSEEVSSKFKGRSHSPETLAKMAHKHEMSESGRQALSASRRGKTLSDETKAKIRLARASQVITEESNQKRRETQTGRQLSAETKAKMSATRKERGIRSSPEHMERLRQIHIGRTHSDETRAKMSASHKRRGTRPPNRWEIKDAASTRFIAEDNFCEHSGIDPNRT